MTRKCIISAIVMFVMAWALSFVVHGLLLGPDYYAMPGMRPPAEAQQIIYWIILAQAIFGTAFAWVYYQGKEDKPWLMQGARFGIAAFSAIINPPHATILAVGAARRAPVEAPDGSIRFADMMTVTLSCDHRVVDGALGAELLSAFKGFIESPVTMMV